MDNIIRFDKRVVLRREKMADISMERKKEIELLIQPLITDIDYIKSPCVDIVSLVKKNGFVVQTSAMDVNTTGCLIVNDIETVMNTKSHRLIVVNKFFDNNGNDDNYILKKSRFITAHEYGHFILHRENNQPIYAHRDTHHRTDLKELEADYFARAILMPLDIFNKYISVIKELNIFTNKAEAIRILSTIFKVTKDKANKRINDVFELEGIN